MQAGDLIYLARTKARLTQADLGARAGLAQNAVSRLERGEVEPGFGTVVRLVRACGLEIRFDLVPADDSYEREIRRRLAVPPGMRLALSVATVGAAQRARRAGLGR